MINHDAISDFGGLTKDVPAQHIAIGIPATNRPRKKDECIKLVDPDYYI